MVWLIRPQFARSEKWGRPDFLTLKKALRAFSRPGEGAGPHPGEAAWPTGFSNARPPHPHDDRPHSLAVARRLLHPGGPGLGGQVRNAEGSGDGAGGRPRGVCALSRPFSASVEWEVGQETGPARLGVLGTPPSPLSRVGCLNPVFSHAPSPGGPSPRSPSSAGASVPWARVRPTACQRLYTGSGLPPPRSPQGRLAASLRIPTATGAAGGARPESRYVSRTPACGKASAMPSSLADAGHISARPLTSSCIGAVTSSFKTP